MKKLPLFILFLLLTSSFFAQQDVQLPGVVVEQNSAFRDGQVHYLRNARVTSDKAAPQLSGSDGKFTLVFADQPAGNVVSISAAKKRYELVNTKELASSAVLNRKTPLKVEMCRTGTLYENQVTYYAIAKDATQASYEKQLAQLEQKGRAQELALAKMRVALSQEITTVNQAKELLLKQLHTAQQQAKELADKFVTVNLDDQSKNYQRAFRAFLAKDIEGALEILDSVDLEQRLATNQAAMEKEQSLIDTLQVSLAERAQQIKQDVNQAVFKARLHILQYEFGQAEESFELALEYRGEEVSLLSEYAYFLQEQNRFKKAKRQYY